MVLPIKSTDAQRVCTLSGAQQKIFAEKLLTLKDLEKTLLIAIDEASRAIKDEYFWRAMELAAKIVAVSCDIAIAGLENGAGPAGKAVSVTYDASKLVVDALNKDLNFSKALLYSTGAKADGVAAHLESIAKSTGNLSAEAGAKYISRAKTLVSLGYDLFGYLKGGEKISDLSAPSGSIAARRTALAHLQRIRKQLRDTEEALQACASPAPGQGTPASASPRLL